MALLWPARYRLGSAGPLGFAQWAKPSFDTTMIARVSVYSNQRKMAAVNDTP
jgi:hypothetical protein